MKYPPPCYNWKHNRLARMAAQMRVRYLYNGRGCASTRKAIMKRTEIIMADVPCPACREVRPHSKDEWRSYHPNLPNPDCPACADRRRHTVREWREHHPLAGHGYSEGQGWSHPSLVPAIPAIPASSPATRTSARELGGGNDKAKAAGAGDPA